MPSDIHRSILLCALCTAITACVNLQSTEWEDLAHDREPVLNVFGLISLDPQLESFVRLYRSTNLRELSEIRVDPFAVADQNKDGELDDNELLALADSDGDGAISDGEWLATADLDRDGTIDEEEWQDLFTPRYEPAAVLANARVVVSTGSDSTLFEWRADRQAYYSNSSDFAPKSGTRYGLEITAAGFNSIVGSLITPEMPVFAIELHPDTLKVGLSKTVDLSWQSGTMGKGVLTGKMHREAIGADGNKDTDFDPQCVSLYKVVNLEEGTYTTDPVFCDRSFTRPYLLRLTAMDTNYYEYFVTGEFHDYANILFPSNTTQGWGVGIDGGYGVFGAIASDSMQRIISVESWKK